MDAIILNIISRKQIQTRSENKSCAQFLLLGWWIVAIELISELFGFCGTDWWIFDLSYYSHNLFSLRSYLFLIMYPSHMWTSSYPMHYAPPNDDPRAKQTPFHMKMDPNTTLNSHSPYHQPWSYAGNCCYPVPHEYYGCYNHNYFGGAPYPHYPPSPPTFHTHGLYNPFPGAYPAYSTPPPHYSVDQPRYDYDKNNHVPHHCCGCNHQENEKKSGMEQEEPEVGKKTSQSFVPLFLKDSPYPITWVPPPGNMNTESKAKDREKRSQDPVSLKNVEPVKRAENGDGDHLPFPIFWLPYKNNEVGNDTKDNNLDLVAHKGLPDENKRQGSDSEAESETRNKHVVQKVIPVKQVGANEEKKSIETKMKSDSVEKTDNVIEVEKASPKACKLPPVCLRIDPLPRKKKTSRSPSPPGDKERSKSSQQQAHLPESLKKEVEQSKGNIETIVVTTDENKVENNSLADLCENVPKGEKGKLEEKKSLSEQEAALMIQSAYRGFEVRKSHPLTKLRQIGEVTKHAVEISNRIQNMESSSSTICIDDKQKLIIGETIMSLLLKLDTIQGLHPLVRDVRKSVAKELVGLQEKLDSLTSIKSENPIEETVSSIKQAMHLEDDAIEENADQSDANVTSMDSGLGLSGNHGVNAKESHDEGGAEAYNTNLDPQLELRKEESVRELNINNEQPVDDVTQQKFDQTLTQFDSTNEAIDCVGNGGVEALDIKPEQRELNNNQIQMLVETGQPVDNSNQEKSDHVQAESDSTHEDVGLDTVIFENHEVEAIDYVDNNAEGIHDTKTVQLIEQNTGELNSDKHQMLVETEQPLDKSIQEKSDEVQAESGTIDQNSDIEICEHHEAESAESYNDAAEAGDISFEPQVESESQQSILELTNNLEIGETEQPPVEKENLDQTQAQFESDIENVEAGEHFNMEDIESQDVSLVEMNVELSKEDTIKGIQEDLIVPTEEAPKTDDVESDGDGKLLEDLGGVSPMSSTNGGDRKLLMEENEKLRVAVEELLKAGNEQLGVIRELTGRVKDLEKKLSKKNKKIKVNKCRSRGFVVQDVCF